MKKIKLSLNFLPMILLIGLTVFMSSCEKDPCNDVDCGDNGICIEGICDCDAGYEGVNCETLSRAKMIGNYTVTEDCSQSSPASYNISITGGVDADAIRITGLWGGAFNNTIRATVNGNNIIIPSQDPDNDNYVISGNLNFNPTIQTVTGSYSVQGPTNTDICSDTEWVKI